MKTKHWSVAVSPGSRAIGVVNRVALARSVSQTFDVLAARALMVAGLLFCVGNGLARPRPQQPPLPESVGPVLHHESFDWAYLRGMTNAELVIANYGTLRESWSGMALQRSGTVTPFIVPAIDANGHTNVASHTGSALRFWITPYWASSFAGGTGPEKEVTLVELIVADAQEAAVVWSLRAKPDGSALVLLRHDDAGPAELLRAEINWTRAAHCLALNFGPDGTALFVDGELAATGSGTLAVPPKSAALVFGSTWSGKASAEGDLEEIWVFGRPLSERAVARYCSALREQAARGPVTEAEWLAQLAAIEKLKAERESAALAAQQDGDYELDSMNCVTNGPVFITNLVCALDTNQGWTVTFDVEGGTNGLAYDIFSATNLVGNSVTNGPWQWLGQGYACNTYSYTNQPQAMAFFMLGDATLDPDGDGLGTAFERLVSKTNPGHPDTDGDGMPDGWEVLQGLNPLLNDGDGDLDSDGICNLDEWRYGLNPKLDDALQPGASQQYRYDANGRLTELLGFPHQWFLYDKEGNITQAGN